MDILWRWRRREGLPPLKLSFVDIDDIITLKRSYVKALKSHHVNGEDVTKDRYAAPLYHYAFLAMNKIIFIDSSDLIFVSDVKDLFDQFYSIDDEANAVFTDH